MNEICTSTSQVNMSAQELFQLAENLKQMVNQFKVYLSAGNHEQADVGQQIDGR